MPERMDTPSPPLKGSREVNGSAKTEMFIFHDRGVQIICKHPETIQQFKMQLLKGQHIICELSKTKDSGNVVSTIKNLESCRSQLSNNSVSFFLYNLDNSYTSYYFCQLTILDPPPYRVEILHGEYLHVYESQLGCHLKFWLSIICAPFVVLIISGCVFICWLTKKKYQSIVHEPNSEYMSMAAVNTAKIPVLRGTAPLGDLEKRESEKSKKKKVEDEDEDEDDEEDEDEEDDDE
ncbi:PREDICTED: inducible T-cell costimulator [Chrysochloris asiatica]|uniref:Inducible T-cell costimulator n=1 Tax=Chrysochloris asiatica TaxID=185453 RepID=A0A9B0TKF4_CHRAS|nr:PREDICTED: inducible T-cell costimulator [Chrysochloris asiatica]